MSFALPKESLETCSLAPESEGSGHLATSRDPDADPSQANLGDQPVAGHPIEPLIHDPDLSEETLLDVDLNSVEFTDEMLVNLDRQMNAEETTVAAVGPAAKILQKQLVLIGAGHAHLQIVDWWPRRKIQGVELTLISAFDRAAYSSMLPGAVAGIYQRDQMLIDLPQLCERSGIRLIVDRANSLDPQMREIEFAHQPTMHFDLASINVGSVPTEEALWQSHRIMISVKPLSSFLARFDARFNELVEQWKQAPGHEMLQVVVVGGGVAGVELAFSLEQRRYELELPIDVRIVEVSSEILNGFPTSTIRKVKKLFHRRGIEASLGQRVISCDDTGPASLILENGERIRADLVIWVTGPAPPMSIQGFQLPKSPDGFLTIRPTLQSTADVPVFIVGDIATLVDRPIPKSGFFAIRQAEVLQHNFKNWFSNQPLINFEPQPSDFSLLSCGDRTAIVSYKGFCVHGSWVWRFKDYFDRKWVRRFQRR